MRIIHTADWHLGHSLNGWSREEEHRVFFDRLGDVLEAEQADILLVAGDIFDNSNPSGEVQKLFYHTLTEFKKRRPGLVTIISGGNHDPAHRLEAPSSILQALDVHVVGTVTRIEGEIDISRLLIPIPDIQAETAATMQNGSKGVALYVLAIPFLRASDLPGLSFGAEQGGSPVVEAAKAFYEDVASKALEIAGDVPIIATSHLHCAGGLESEGAERRILIGGSHALPVSVFPDCLAYVALGHLHGQQTLGDGRIRYSGSCFPLSASEIRYSHGVTLAELKNGAISHAHIPIKRPAPVLRIPANGTIALDDLASALASIEIDETLPMGLKPIVYLEMEADDSAAIIMTEASKMVAEQGLRLGGLKIHKPQQQAMPADEVMENLSDTTPEQLFISAYEAKNGILPQERHLSAFREILVET